jgi:RHS repeat-associated protein
VNSGQTVAASYRYDPFGNLVSSSGSLATANVYRFSSKELHVGSGMYYYGYRFYDQSLQRWINRDPLGEMGFQILSSTGEITVAVLGKPDSNNYFFVHNDPANSFDAFGLREPRPNDKEPKCYTKADIPADVQKKLPAWAKKRLEKSCWKCLGMDCCPGVLEGGGVYGVCIKCTF